MVYINLCVCVYVCVSILWGVIYYFYIQLFWVCLCIIIYTHKKKSVQHFIPRERDREGRKKEEEREKIISGASSLVQDHQNETGALQMRYQCLWSTISPFPELVFLVVNSSQRKFIPNIFWGGFVFIFSPVFPKDSSFLFFFANSLHWYRTLQMIWNNPSLEEKFLVELYKKKNLQKSSRRLCPIMDCSTGERILIYIFLRN